MDRRYAIFDMDGVLLDSMPYWKELGPRYLAAHGIQMDGVQFQQARASIQTLTMQEAAQFFIDRFGLTGQPEQVVEEMHAAMRRHYREDIGLKPGVAAYLAALRENGVSMCVATATTPALARECLDRLGIAGFFSFLVSCEEIRVSKDRPDLYLLAADRLGTRAADAAVFEDALYAARTAKAAGFYTVAVYDESAAHDWPQLFSLADETIRRWEDAVRTIPSRKL